MEFALSEEQAMIRDAAAEVLDQHSGSAAVRRAVEQSSGHDEALWRLVARELGWCALSVPEAAGGSGLGAMELILLLEAMGQRLACVPYLSTVCLAGTLLSCCDSPRARERLGRIANGELRATLASSRTWAGEAYDEADEGNLAVSAQRTAGGYRLRGAVEQVIDGAGAGLVIVAARLANDEGRLALFEVEPGEGLVRTPLVTLDSTRPLARLEFKDIEVSNDALLAQGEEAHGALGRAAWLAPLALAAEQLGGAQRCLDLTLAYVEQRVQFGRSIASFQAIKHRCAQMLVQIESTRSAVLGAALAWDADTSAAVPARETQLEVATAKASANETLRFCAQEAIQLHGGVGFTWEYDPQLYFKRAQAASAMFGETAPLRAFIAQQIVDEATTW
ncbi:alkylation response protein AidB-like acyl-CoA dehydrogenase [Paraburkholderia unamae]|uniref:acyl-CoA dehydrogenase family protein n=1 Tax=Paraburkholderia unamae TaxID=219649 RepID=UPI000DC505B1|nr:acyl-CoA dehydrogenase family protein [Paraburkholderia unamae]RAR53349.1 alkylation response protein AidB-like acyl-CoA dehydrogenase [Paraburkholderia unamae]